MLYNYLIIRYKVFVIELGRSALKELSKLDVYCKHYVLLLDNVVIGTSRLCYTDNVVELMADKIFTIFIFIFVQAE